MGANLWFAPNQLQPCWSDQQTICVRERFSDYGVARFRRACSHLRSVVRVELPNDYSVYTFNFFCLHIRLLSVELIYLSSAPFHLQSCWSDQQALCVREHIA